MELTEVERQMIKCALDYLKSKLNQDYSLYPLYYGMDWFISWRSCRKHT